MGSNHLYKKITFQLSSRGNSLIIHMHRKRLPNSANRILLSSTEPHPTLHYRNKEFYLMLHSPKSLPSARWPSIRVTSPRSFSNCTTLETNKRKITVVGSLPKICLKEMVWRWRCRSVVEFLLGMYRPWVQNQYYTLLRRSSYGNNNFKSLLGMVAHNYKLPHLGGWCRITVDWGQPELHAKFQDRQG